VVDPLEIPNWADARYRLADIRYVNTTAESTRELNQVNPLDEIWMYNVLQHVQDPERVVRRIRATGAHARLFDWVDTVVNVLHPHSISSSKLNEWIGALGIRRHLRTGGAVGTAWVYVGQTDGRV
jgi:hypothetical protein